MFLGSNSHFHTFWFRDSDSLAEKAQSSITGATIEGINQNVDLFKVSFGKLTMQHLVAVYLMVKSAGAFVFCHHSVEVHSHSCPKLGEPHPHNLYIFPSSLPHQQVSNPKIPSPSGYCVLIWAFYLLPFASSYLHLLPSLFVLLFVLVSFFLRITRRSASSEPVVFLTRRPSSPLKKIIKLKEVLDAITAFLQAVNITILKCRTLLFWDVPQVSKFLDLQFVDSCCAESV